MRRSKALFALAVFSMIAGAALLALSVANGDADLYFVLLFPVLSVKGATGILGALLLIVGLFSLPILLFRRASGGTRVSEKRTWREASGSYGKEGRGDVGSGVERKGSRAGGVIFIGPVPIVFGSDRGVAKWMIAVAVLIGFLMLALFLFGSFGHW